MREKLSLAYDTILSDEDLLCIWFDPRKGYGLFRGRNSLKERLIHRDCIAISRTERSRLRRGAIVKMAEWEVV